MEKSAGKMRRKKEQPPNILGIYHTQKGWLFCIWPCVYIYSIYLYYPLEPGFGLSAVLANFRQNPSAGAGCTSDRFWTWEQKTS